jgi:hypothetical protein
MLSSQGYTVLHSTRHTPTEFGKDIIARATDGSLHAYQLKANPSSRLTVGQVQQIQGQLLQLVTQAITFPGKPHEDHVSHLVTNGEVDEDARQAIREIGENLSRIGYRHPHIDIIARGQLLAMAREAASGLWPSELEDVNPMLQLFVHDGRTLFPVEILDGILRRILRLDMDIDGVASQAEGRRRVSSAAVLTGVCLRTFTGQNNYYASVMAWTLFCVYAIGFCERYGFDFRTTALPAVQIAKGGIFYNLSQLCEELSTRAHYVEGDVLVDPTFYRARMLLLVALMAMFSFWCGKEVWPKEEYRTFIASFIPPVPKHFWLWGEGAIPQFLAYLWYLRATDASPRPDILLADLLAAVCSRNAAEGSEFLASPYYTVEEVVRHDLRQLVGEPGDRMERETGGKFSFFAEGLLHLLVRSGLKNRCKSVWPSYSRLHLRWFSPGADWQFCLWRSREGIEKGKQPPLYQTWSQLCTEARSVAGEGIPSALREEDLLLLLWVIVAPHRATPAAVRYLGWRFNDCWFIDPPLA